MDKKIRNKVKIVYTYSDIQSDRVYFDVTVALIFQNVYIVYVHVYIYQQNNDRDSVILFQPISMFIYLIYFCFIFLDLIVFVFWKEVFFFFFHHLDTFVFLPENTRGEFFKLNFLTVLILSFFSFD